MSAIIRRETPADLDAIRAVNKAAFETAAEADLVDALRSSGNAKISLVAEVDGQIVAHILFSPMTFAGESKVRSPLGLAPMAVHPELQRKGIGSKLVTTGLAECKAIGCQAVFVLGHPEYYPRFDFVSASGFGIRSTYDVPDEVFMAIELVPGALDDSAGEVRYSPEFDDL